MDLKKYLKKLKKIKVRRGVEILPLLAFVMITIVSFFSMSFVYGVKDAPLIDGTAYGAADSKSGAVIFQKEENSSFAPNQINGILTLAALYEGGYLEGEEAEIGKLIDENDIENIREFIKEKLGDETDAITKANEVITNLGLENTKIGTLEGNGSGDLTTIREASQLMSKVLGSDDVRKELSLKKISKKSDVSYKVLAQGTEEDIYSLSIGQKGDSYFTAITVGGATADGNLEDSNKILKYSLNKYRTYRVLEKGEVVDKIKVKGGRKSYCKVVAAGDLYVTLPKEADDDIVKRKITIDKDLIAPVEKGVVVGRLDAMEAGDITGSVSIVTKENIVTGGPWSKIGISDYMMAIGSTLIILLLIFVIVIKRKRKKKLIRIAKEKEEKRRREELRLAKEREEKRRRNWPY